MSAQRTRADEARRIVGRLREEFFDLGDCEVHVHDNRDVPVAAMPTSPRHVVTISIVIDAPDEPAP